MVQPEGMDGTVHRAAQDSQTVTSEGRSIAPAIAGVVTRQPVVHTDHRGRVFEMYPGQDEFWTKPVVYCYMFSIRAGQVKGWGLHLEKDDRYTLISGEVMVILCDARLDSPTHGLIQRVYLSEQGLRQLVIPTGVWHLSVNLAQSETMLVNHPTEPYHHERPDRLMLAWDSPEIAIDVARYFPIQQSTRFSHECS